MTKIVLIDDQEGRLLIKTFLGSIDHRGDIVEFFRAAGLPPPSRANVTKPNEA